VSRILIISKKGLITTMSVVLVVASISYAYWRWQTNNSPSADTIGGCTSSSVDWEISPCSSPDNPVKSRQIAVKVKKPVSRAKFYNVVSTGITGTNINTWVDRDEGVVVFPDSITALAATTGSFSLSISAWTGKSDDGGTKISDFSQTLTVYYDLSYQGLTFNLTANTLDKGDFVIKATPTGKYASLNNQTTYYAWFFSKPDGYLSKASTKFTTTPELKLRFDTPGVAYVSMAAYSGGVGYTWGEFRRASSDFGLSSNITGSRIRLKLKTEAGATPDDTSSFSPNNIVISDKAIPGDFKLPLEKDSISIFSGGSFSFPVHSDGYIFSNPLNSQVPADLYYAYRNPQYIEIDLPASINLHQQNFKSETKFTEIADNTGSNPIAPGYHRYKIEKINPNGQWGEINASLPIYLVFPDSLSGTPNLKIRYRNYMANQESRSDLWQEQTLNCVTVPNDIQLPKRLMTSFGVAYSKSLFVNNGTGKDINDFLALYKKLGFNTVPNPWNEGKDPVSGDFIYTPEDRQSDYWQGLNYGPEYSLFHSSYSTMGIFGALKPSTFNTTSFTLTKDNLDNYAASLDFNAKFRTSLVEPQLSIEKENWKKAIKFYFDSGGVLDMAYNGVILQKNLEHLSKFVETVKPENLSLDSEGYPYSFSTWVDKVTQSQNAQSRKQAGESNYDLARRMIDEWTAGLTDAVYQKSPNTRIGMYGVRAEYNLGYQVIPWDILQKYHIIPQPTEYGPGHNLDMLSKGIRSDRSVLSQNYRLDPWLGIGWAGEFDSEYVFDQVIHTFLNGATGFSIYSVYELDDMSDILEISKAIKIVSPHEDLIMDGQLAFGDISGATNATVSAMKKDGEYLIGVTPKDKQNSVRFAINTGNTIKYRLLDERTNESALVDGPKININKALSSSTVYSLKAEPTVAPSPAPAPSLAPSPTPTPGPSSVPSVTVTSTTTKAPAPTPVPLDYVIPIQKGFTYFDIPQNWGTVEIDAARSSSDSTIWQYNWFGDQLWQPTPHKVAVTTLRPGVGYYVSTNSDNQSLVFKAKSDDGAIPMIKPGWNLLSNSSTAPIDIASKKVRVLKAGQDTACNTASCAEEVKTIKELVDQSIVYDQIWLIRNATAADAAKAFGNPLDSRQNGAQIPGADPTQPTHTQGYWIYSWER